MISAHINPRDIKDIDQIMAAFPAEGRRAARRSVTRTLSWVRTHGRRALSQDSGVPLKALRLRRRVAVKTSLTGDRLKGIAWFGTLPIKAASLGTPRQTKTGAVVRGVQFKGAFVATMPSGHTGIFRRTGKSRLPITEQTVPLEGARAAVQSVFDRAAGELHKNFMAEFRWVLQGERRA